MRLIYKNRYKSITFNPSDEELSNFVVLSGPNGSGKSSLLEAISKGNIEIEGIPFNPAEPNQIKLFTLSQFALAEEGAQNVNNYQGSWINLKNQVISISNELTQAPNYLEQGSATFYQTLRQQLIARNVITEHKLTKAEQSAGKEVTGFTDSDYRNHLDRIYVSRNAFELGINEIFLSYHAKRNTNEYAQYLKDKKGRENLDPLSDEEFIQKYGPAPWELFDETLSIVGLSNYKFVYPNATEEEIPYTPSLIDSSNGETISVKDLSSGEKTLLAVAMTLYSGTNHDDDILMPKVLLLDEADASLHPSMIESLLRVIKEIIVDKFAIKVITTTHSPTTIALAPEDSIYTMMKSRTPRLKKAVSKDEALKIVAVGLPTLSVKFDNRVQTFVEAEEDARCYDAIYNIVSPKLGGQKSISFIASGKGAAGNVTAVKHLVSKMNAAGNNSIKGLVDRDNRTTPTGNIFFSSERYSLENLILDPFSMAVFLIRERIITPESIGLPSRVQHTNLLEYSQTAVSSISEKLKETEDNSITTIVRYFEGAQLNIPTWILNMQGHELQTRYVSKFQALIPYDRDKSLLIKVINNAMFDLPACIPATITDVFHTISTSR